MKSAPLLPDEAEIAAAQSVVGFEASRDVISVNGPESAGYLQGQISQDVEQLAIGDAAWSFVLQPQGKVDGWFRITRTAEETFELDLDAGFGEGVLARLERFKLRTKADFSLATVPMLAVRGPEAVAPPETQPRALVRPGQAGFDLLGDDVQRMQDLPLGPDGVLDTLRVRAGVPAMGTELTEKTIPAEAGVVDESVSFTKGCYVGQELVARVDSRGNNTPRNLFGIVAADGGELAGGEVLADGEPIGTVTSSAVSAALGSVALAYVRRGADVPGAATVRTTSGDVVAVQVEALPF